LTGGIDAVLVVFTGEWVLVKMGGLPGAGRMRRYRSGALTAVAAMGELMVVKAASQLCLLQVGSNMLVGHFLQAGLEEVVFLRSSAFGGSTWKPLELRAYLFFGPGAVSSGGRELPSPHLRGEMMLSLVERRDGSVVLHLGKCI
jgi:hypothetical protein